MFVRTAAAPPEPSVDSITWRPAISAVVAFIRSPDRTAYNAARHPKTCALRDSSRHDALPPTSRGRPQRPKGHSKVSECTSPLF